MCRFYRGGKKMRTITAEELKKILEAHELWLQNQRGARADLIEADLSGADLSGADLSGADLGGADLGEADLSGADLSGADLSGADLREANLSGADLSGANLRGADLGGACLGGADLSGADLRGADLDFSCLPLRCGGLRWKIDKRVAAQLAYHFCSMECDDPDFIVKRNSLLDFANQFHRMEGCGRLTPVEIRDGEKGAASAREVAE
jgi:hypothetical protein